MEITNDINVIKQILDGSSQIIMVTDAETLSIVYANAQAKKLRGLTSDSFAGYKCHKYLREQDGQCIDCPLKTIGNRTETHSVYSNGSSIYATDLKLIEWNGRKAYVEYIQNITITSHSDNIYRTEIDAIVNSIPNAQGICHIDLDSDKIIRLIRPAKKMIVSEDATAEEFLMEIEAYITNDKDKQTLRNTFSCENLKSLYRSGQKSVFLIIEIQKTDGSIGYSKLSAILVMNPKNNHLECLSFGIDITSQIAFEKQMEETNQLNKTLATEYSTIIALNLHDGSMRLKKMETTQNAMKLNPHEVMQFEPFVKMYVENFVIDEYKEIVRKNFVLQYMRECVDNGKRVLNVRYKVKPNDAGQENFEALVLPVKTDDPYQMVIGIKCIDNLVQQEEKEKAMLETSRQNAEAANRAKTTFLFNMSHDIRTPMNAIVGYTDLMQQHLDDKEKLQDYLKKAKASSKLLLELINNVLEVARIDSGKMELDEQPYKLMDIIEEVKDVYVDQMKAKGIKVVLENDVTVKTIYCDALKIKEILLNLLSNALKYTPAGGTITNSLKQLPCEKEGFVTLECQVADTGIGMSKEFIPTLFEEFTREHTSTDNKIQGTGLGMHIVKKLVDLMGGNIKVESEQGKGTTFTVTITYRIADDDSCEKETNAYINDYCFKGKRILLAEDNELNAEIAIEILSSTGLEVDWAENGVVCVDKVSKAPAGYYDMILMDIQMPLMNGYNATLAIRHLEDKAKASIPIVAMTANAFEEDKHEALNAGMDGHLAKPINPQEVLSTIASFLNK